MTFADLIWKAAQDIGAHRTKITGSAIVILGALAAQPDLLTKSQLAWCVTGLGILTTLCGVANTSAIARKVTAAKNPIEPPQAANQ